MSIEDGWATAERTASRVTALNLSLRNVTPSRASSSERCQQMASPSRSGSAARKMVSKPEAVFLSDSMAFRLSCRIV